MTIQDQIKEQLEHKFVCGDNFPRDIAEEKRIKNENIASSLIESNLSSRKMNAFMGKDATCNRFKLSTPITIPESVRCEYKSNSGCAEADIEHKYFTINNGKLNICEGNVKIKDDKLPLLTGFYMDSAKDRAREKAQQILSQIPYYEIFSQITRFDTPEKIIRFFAPGILCRNGCSHLPKDCIPDTAMDSVCSVDSIQEFNKHYYSLQGNNVNNIPELKVSDWYHTTYIFKDEYGEPVQYVLKPLEHTNALKLLLPCSVIFQTSTSQRRVLLYPGPGPQTLYHLDLISKTDQPTVVLTDSPELAESNQRYAPDNVIWISFLCDEDKFDQMDWEPLKRAKEIYYLINNHSGINFAEAYVKAEKLADYLAEKEGIHLDFIQLQVDYSLIPPRGFDCVEDMIDHRTYNKPQIDLNSLIFHDKDRYSFNEMCEKAKQSLLPVVKKEFWESPNGEVPETTDVSEPKIRKPIEFNYMLYPILANAQTSMFYALSGLGKSCAAYNMSACVVTRSKFISGRFWNTSKLIKKDYKVLYLDYEMDESIIADRVETFVDPYFKDNAMLRSNLTFESLRDKKNDYNIITKEGQRNVKKLLDKYQKQGTHDGEIDLLVIDSYTKAVGSSEFNNTWGEAEGFFSKLNKKGIAVLIIHHANQDGKSRGFAHKTDDLLAKFKIHRDGKGTLNVPFIVETEKLRLNKVDMLFEDFQAKFDGKKFVVHGENDERALLEDIFKTYNKKPSRMTQEEIAAVVGISKNTLRKKLNLNK